MPGGVIMSLSTFVVLLGLTFGQSALLTLGLFVLWLAGEIGGGDMSEHSIDPPESVHKFAPTRIVRSRRKPTLSPEGEFRV
jgi:hypothetical protein